MNFKEQRRHPRVTVHSGLAEVLNVFGAEVTWPNQETSAILDLSYKGLAARRPGLFPVAVQTSATVRIRLGTAAPFLCPARVAWCNLDTVGLELAELPPEAYAAFRGFLDAKLIGGALKPVERVFFSPGAGFTHWFQGPEGVHVFVWLNSAKLIGRVNVDLGTPGTVEFERGTGPWELDPDQRKALLILSQMDKPGLPMEEFLRTLAPGRMV